jgi:signal transduction histidine kinase
MRLPVFRLPSHLSFQLSSRSPSTNLRWLWIVPFVTQMSLAVGLVGYLAYRNEQQAITELADQLMSKTGKLVDQHLDGYLQQPWQVTQLVLDDLTTDRLKITDFKMAGRYFWNFARVYKNFSYVGYYLENGDGIGVGRWIKDAGLTITERSAATAGKTLDIGTNAKGDRTRTLVSYEYDAVGDTWYTQTAAAGKPLWVKITPTISTNIEVATGADLVEAGTPGVYLAASATTPLYDRQKKLLGVMSVDLMLDSLSTFLHNLEVSPSAQVLIMEQDGLLIADSGLSPIYKGTSEEAQRLNVSESADPVVRAVAAAIKQKLGDLSRITTEQRFEFNHQGKRQLVYVRPWRDERGLSWFVAVTLPASDFTAQLEAHNRETWALGVGAIALAIVISWYTSRWLTRPLAQCSLAAEAIASGQLGQKLPRSRLKEIDQLSSAFNAMAVQLQDAFTSLEASNQELSTTNDKLEHRVHQRTQELSQTLHDLKQTQASLVQAEKMSSLGQMVAGIAHEINNPVSFIHGNLEPARHYIEVLSTALQLYQTHYPRPAPAIQTYLDDEDLAFVQTDLNTLLQSMSNGTQRIRDIVLSLRNFSRLDESNLKSVDIHEGIESALLLVQNKLQTSGIKIVRQYGSLPPIECYPRQLNQVFLNLLLNAIDALGNQTTLNSKLAIAPDFLPEIQVHTTLENQQVLLRFSDNGIGVPADISAKIFDPFFTTKPIGQGTGMGLSISYQIIAEHQGTLTYQDSAEGGAEFLITLPQTQISSSPHPQNDTLP